MRLDVRDLSFSYGDDRVLKNVSFSSSGGEAVAVLGPNGVGKSTFFKCILGFLPIKNGKIEIDGKDVSLMKGKELSKYIAYIPQSSNPVFNHTVLESVAMGMNNQIGLFSVPGEKEREKAAAALDRLGILKLKDRGCLNISGGERQLMLIARAMVQSAKIIVMDEPTSSLDYGNSYRVMETIMSLSKDGYTILFSTHDPDAAMRYSDRVIAFYNGEIIRDGKPSTVLSTDVLSTLYSINVAIRNVRVREKEYSVCIPTGHDTTDSAGCVVFRGDEVLLVSFSKRIGFPKGHIENGESMEETALRETFEETGIKARIVEAKPYRVPSTRPGDQRSVYFYKAEYVEGETMADGGEVDKAFWVDKEKVTELLSFSLDREMYNELNGDKGDERG